MANLSVDQALARARAHEKKGNVEAARSIYQDLITTFPGNSRARQAMDQLSSRYDPPRGTEPPRVKFDELVALYNRGQLQRAADTASALARQYPRSSLLWNMVGAANFGLQRLDDAEHGFRRYSELQPNSPGAQNNLGVVLKERGKLDEAVAAYRRALQIKPDYAEVYSNLGSALRGQGRTAEAVESYRRALQIDPSYAEAHNKLGNALKELGQLDEAVASYQRALELKPDHADALYNLALALKAQGRLSEATDNYLQVLALNPDHAEASNNLGNIFLAQGMSDAAATCYRQTLQSSPNHTMANTSLGHILVERGELEEAVTRLELALQADPDYEQARAILLFCKAQMGDWTADHEFAEIAEEFGTRDRPISPLLALSFEDSPQRQLERSVRWSQEHRATPPVAPLTPRSANPSGRLRIGYFSGDFREHPMMHLMLGLFREHDRSAFEVLAFNHGPGEKGEIQTKLRQHVDHFFDIRPLSDQQAADLARQHEVDIAIDITGYTGNSRPGLSSWRPAPVQISYLGFPSTLGSPFADYIVADHCLVPEDTRAFYSERVIYLPDTYQPNDDERYLSDDGGTRSSCGLPADAFVLCCFNNAHKIKEREFRIWMRVLRQVDGSVLWLLASNPWFEKNLRAQAASCGVDPARLVFAKRLPQADHLARHRHADLFVDTFNFNAHTTCSDALWGGLPVVTKAGQQFAARVAASLLSAVGLPELITTTDEEYEALIIELATNPERLATLKRKLANNRLTFPLFDTKQYVRTFEAALKTVHRRHAEGLDATDIVVPRGGAASSTTA